MNKHTYTILAALLTCILSTAACVEDDGVCTDPEGFQGEFGCVYEPAETALGQVEIEGVDFDSAPERAARLIPRDELVIEERHYDTTTQWQPDLELTWPPRTTARRPSFLDDREPLDPCSVGACQRRITEPVPLPWIPAGLSAPTSEEIERVKLLLMSYDSALSTEDYERVARDPRAVLQFIWGDTTLLKHVRLQALDILSIFPPDKTVRTLYREILAGRPHGVAPPEVHRAINGLLLGFGDDAVEDVAPLLSSSDVNVRLTLAHAMGSMAGDLGRTALRDHLRTEPNDTVRQVIEQHLSELR